MWESLNIDSKQVFQNLLFSEGIYYNHENNQVRTPRVNSFFSLIPELARYTEGHKKRDFIKTDKIPAFVIPGGLEPPP
jgi:site-specific DNA recombinase